MCTPYVSTWKNSGNNKEETQRISSEKRSAQRNPAMGRGGSGRINKVFRSARDFFFAHRFRPLLVSCKCLWQYRLLLANLETSKAFLNAINSSSFCLLFLFSTALRFLDSSSSIFSWKMLACPANGLQLHAHVRTGLIHRCGRLE